MQIYEEIRIFAKINWLKLVDNYPFLDDPSHMDAVINPAAQRRELTPRVSCGAHRPKSISTEKKPPRDRGLPLFVHACQTAVRKQSVETQHRLAIARPSADTAVNSYQLRKHERARFLSATNRCDSAWLIDDGFWLKTFPGGRPLVDV